VICRSRAGLINPIFILSARNYSGQFTLLFNPISTSCLMAFGRVGFGRGCFAIHLSTRDNSLGSILTVTGVAPVGGRPRPRFISFAIHRFLLTMIIFQCWKMVTLIVERKTYPAPAPISHWTMSYPADAGQHGVRNVQDDNRDPAATGNLTSGWLIAAAPRCEVLSDEGPALWQ